MRTGPKTGNSQLSTTKITFLLLLLKTNNLVQNFGESKLVQFDGDGYSDGDDVSDKEEKKGGEMGEENNIHFIVSPQTSSH